MSSFAFDWFLVSGFIWFWFQTGGHEQDDGARTDVGFDLHVEAEPSTHAEVVPQTRRELTAREIGISFFICSLAWFWGNASQLIYLSLFLFIGHMRRRSRCLRRLKKKARKVAAAKAETVAQNAGAADDSA